MKILQPGQYFYKVRVVEENYDNIISFGLVIDSDLNSFSEMSIYLIPLYYLKKLVSFCL